ncbi:MAG: tRNA pseudouridine(55) synthase TruB [Alphaproteobacteria bacterium]
MGRRRKGKPITGWVLLDKPVGAVSTKALNKVRWLFGAAKAGHAGTLDPLASGMLPIALGEATKVIARVTDSSKTYHFTVRWGEQRDTDDAEGEVVASSDARPTRAALEAALENYLGDIEQVPPRYSAIKVDGERAYALARDGEHVELASRIVHVADLRLVAYEDGGDVAELALDCGKGTYVRALARDLGRDLGCFGHVASLRRTRVGPFRVEAAISLDNLEALMHKGALETALQPVDAGLADIPAVAITGTEADRLRSGQPIRVPSSLQGTVYAKTGGRPIAMAHLQDGELRPTRVFNL